MASIFLNDRPLQSKRVYLSWLPFNRPYLYNYVKKIVPFKDLTFNVEEVQNIVRDNIEFCLGGNIYSHSRTPQWITVITEKTLSRLNKLNKPFKYIMRMTVTQKNGTGLHTAAAYFWDIATDGTCTVRWENKYMYCIVNIWALALQL